MFRRAANPLDGWRASIGRDNTKEQYDEKQKSLAVASEAFKSITD
jgi:hypothetical protein